METDLNNWNVGMDWFVTANTRSVEICVGVGRIAFPISNFVILIFSVLNLLWTPAIMHWWHYCFFTLWVYVENFVRQLCPLSSSFL
jgi:hypothetical protein